ncbi:class I SAM-dependent methyltransferase [Sandaracinus amylolyticus]|nr:class I SAM-dependent methyltransferase [Sandaracinus amylolyticus]
MTPLKQVWDREVVGRLLDHGMSGVDPLRAELLRDVRGRVVEIGFGTGANLPFYPDAVSELVAVEPSVGLAERARPRLEAWGRPHRVVSASASRPLPLDARSFDAAVVTFVLCSVNDVKAVLGEVARLLAPGAPLFLAEHVAAPRGALRQVQKTIRPAWSALLGGCDPARDTRARLDENGWDTSTLRDVALELPYPVRPGLVGTTRLAARSSA